MNYRKVSTIVMVVMMTVLFSLAGGLAIAAERAPMTPELAAKKEMVRKQRVQRVTDAKRKTAAEALKAERLKIHQAKQATQPLAPINTDNK